MHATPAHGSQGGDDVVIDAGELEGVYAPVGEGEIDGSAGLAGRPSRIAAAFVQRDCKAATLQKDGEERARGSSADDIHGTLEGCRHETHGARARVRPSTAAKTSL